MTISVDLAPCPFCGCTPSLTEPEWKDECRYFGTVIRCCCEMTIGVGWIKARDLSYGQRIDAVKALVEKEWNEPLRKRNNGES